MVKWLADAVTEKVTIALTNYITDLMNNILITLTNLYFDNLNPGNMAAFWSWIGYSSASLNPDESWAEYSLDKVMVGGVAGAGGLNMYAVFALIGFVLAITIFTLNIASLFFGPIGEQKESPAEMVIRFLLALMLVSYSNTIFSQLSTLISGIYETTLGMGTEGTDGLELNFIGAAVDVAEVAITVTNPMLLVPTLVVAAVCAVILIKNIMSYMVDTVTSYLCVMFLYMILPAVLGTYASKKTSLLTPYFKMLVSTYVLVITRVVIFRFAIYATTKLTIQILNGGIFSIVNGTFIVLAFIQLGNKCDALLKGLGLSPASTGGRLMDSFIGGVTEVAGKAMKINGADNTMRKNARSIAMQQLGMGDEKGAAATLNRAGIRGMVSSWLGKDGPTAGSAHEMREALNRKNDPLTAAQKMKATGYGAFMNDQEKGYLKAAEAKNDYAKANTKAEKQAAMKKFNEGAAQAHGGNITPDELESMYKNNGMSLDTENMYTGKGAFRNLQDDIKSSNRSVQSRADGFLKDHAGQQLASGDAKGAAESLRNMDVSGAKFDSNYHAANMMRDSMDKNLDKYAKAASLRDAGFADQMTTQEKGFAKMHDARNAYADAKTMTEKSKCIQSALSGMSEAYGGNLTADQKDRGLKELGMSPTLSQAYNPVSGYRNTMQDMASANASDRSNASRVLEMDKPSNAPTTKHYEMNSSGIPEMRNSVTGSDGIKSYLGAAGMSAEHLNADYDGKNFKVGGKTLGGIEHVDGSGFNYQGTNQETFAYMTDAGFAYSIEPGEKRDQAAEKLFGSKDSPVTTSDAAEGTAMNKLIENDFVRPDPDSNQEFHAESVGGTEAKGASAGSFYKSGVYEIKDANGASQDCLMVAVNSADEMKHMTDTIKGSQGITEAGRPDGGGWVACPKTKDAIHHLTYTKADQATEEPAEPDNKRRRPGKK